MDDGDGETWPTLFSLRHPLFSHLRIFLNILTCEYAFFHRQTLGLTGMLASWYKHAAHCIDIIIYYLLSSQGKFISH